MYDVTNKSRKELVVEICRQLNEHGLFDYDDPFGANETEFSTDYGFGAGLLYMPKENIQKILQCKVDDWSEFRKVYNTWGRAGALRFDPYVVDKHDNPSLVVRHNRYIHMFRGYRFQASGTIDGVGDYGTSSYNTNFLTQSSYAQQVLQSGIISYMLWWAALIDIGFRFDNFIELFNTNKKVLEEFLDSSRKYWNITKKYSWSDIEPYVQISTGNIDKYTRRVYQLQKDDKVIDAYMCIGKKTVQVETPGNNLVTIIVPDLLEGTNYNLEDEDDTICFEDDVRILKQSHFLEMLLVMALKLAGIDLNFMGYYHVRKPKVKMRLKPVNAPGVIVTKTLNDIYKAEPDTF